MNVLVTGANGFVGSSLLWRLAQSDIFACTALSRSSVSVPGVASIMLDNFDNVVHLSEVLIGQNVVIHCAARAHVMRETAADKLADYQKVNVEGTLNLARSAISAGVTRFIYISSIKVNGERTITGKAFCSDDIPNPEDPYGVSKYQAEVELAKLVECSSMELVVIRPPLIYGPGVKGNFRTLINLCRKGWPLPFGAINNERSFVFIDNLVSLITICIDHTNAANEVFLVSDGDDLSTPMLIKLISKALRKQVFLLSVPQWILANTLKMLGKQSLAERLFGTLIVDIDKTRKLLGWEPSVSVEEGIRRCVQGIRQ